MMEEESVIFKKKKKKKKIDNHACHDHGQRVSSTRLFH